MQELAPEEARWVGHKIKGDAEGYFIGKYAGVNSLISFTAPDNLSWQYVRITPYDNITRQTNSIRNATLLIAALILQAM